MILRLLVLTRPCLSQSVDPTEPPAHFILPANLGDFNDGMVDYTFEYGSAPNFQWALNVNASLVDLTISNAAGNQYTLLS